MGSKIKNIIFDLGNVLLDLDFDRAEKAFEKLVGAERYPALKTGETERLFLDFELGNFSEEAFLNAIQRMITPVPDARKVIEAWNALLVGIPKDRLQLLEQLKSKGFQLFLLSNTNSLHIQWLNRHLKKQYNIEALAPLYFQKAYYSCQLKLRKPNREIFEYVLADASIKAAESLFIDDNLSNISTAYDLGISTIHFSPGSSLEEALQDVL